MLIQTGTIGIIADDLTGANDTALQFHLSGANTQILFDYNHIPEGTLNTRAWAISTETRNVSAEKASEIVRNAARQLTQNLNAEHFYKKIDSTIRGNIGVEVLALIEELEYDAAIVVPAFPSEGRTTIGGYHLLKGTPLDRTEFARDPHSPVRESHIPTLIKSQIGDKADIVEKISLKTVTKGAGPILMDLQEHIRNGKKIIVMDAVSTTDIEQIVLAMNKSNYKILPCGAAALAQACSNIWLPNLEYQHITKTLPDIPVLMVSGSATALTKTQIERLSESDDFEPYIIEFSLEQVLTEPSEELVQNICDGLSKYKYALLHASSIENNSQANIDYATENGIEPEKIPTLITDFLAILTSKIIAKTEVILVLIGGETSYKCCNTINSKHLQLIDEVAPAIPLCLDLEAQWIVTKSGNLGNPTTLIQILKYFERHK